jgi:hypothetical protein
MLSRCTFLESVLKNCQIVLIFYLRTDFTESRDTADGLATGCGLDNKGVGVLLLVGA